MSKYTYPAQVTAVYDADTITVDINLGFHTWRRNEKIRLFGINAPEVRGDSKPEGIKSRDWLRDKILGKEVSIQTVKARNDTDKRGKFGRYLAVIWSDGINLNEELVRLGLAAERVY